MSKIYTENYRNEPYWWEAAPRRILTETDIPREIDVAVIGSGYTGLTAALQTARAGRSTLVIERDLTGYGCSSRNGGQVGTSFKPKYHSLSKKFGQSTAIQMIQEGHRALEYIKNFIQTEDIHCDWNQSGRFVGAHSQSAYRNLEKEHAEAPKTIASEYEMVPRSEQSSEIDSDLFQGGCILPAHGGLHSGKYHHELLRCAFNAGVMVIDRCAATAIERISKGFRIHTERGAIDAKDVVLATNGYTGDQFHWHNRRILPIGSYQIATEILPDDLLSTLIPKARMISDTRLVGNYFRLSPDRKRLLFGGRVTFTEANSESGTQTLYQQMTEVFPQLKQVRVDYAWVGYVAYTTDISPHIGVHDGLYYSMGYCGSGITLSSYFGMRVGQKLLGASEGRTGLDDLKFRAWPAISRSTIVLSAATRMTRVAEKFV